MGVLFSRSGYMALIEETQYRGTMIAIDEINEFGRASMDVNLCRRF